MSKDKSLLPKLTKEQIEAALNNPKLIKKLKKSFEKLNKKEFQKETPHCNCCMCRKY